MSNAGIHLTIAFLWLFPAVQVSARTDVSLVHEVVNVHKTTRIVGGDLAEDDRYPYVVSVQMEGAHFCGGTLIAKDVVLTAAHCLSSGSMLQVIVDRIDMTKSDEGDQVAVNMMIAHPEFDVSGTWEYDFALLILARTITTSNVQLMELNIDDHFPPSGTIGTVMGWGDTKQHSNEHNVSDILMTVEAETISNEECASAQGSLDGFNGSYEDWIFSSMICTLSNNQNACKGDSGGPLVVLGEDSTKDVQIGVVSWSMPAGCATRVFPVVYSRISKGIDWFKQHVCALSKEPPGSLCETIEPTSSPIVPTTTPTDYPTYEPSDAPSRTPSAKPSMTPTFKPTFTPTLTPTVSPTVKPTEVPSLITSLSPSPNPSISFHLSNVPKGRNSVPYSKINISVVIVMITIWTLL